MTDERNPLVINDWVILAHPLFLDAVETLTQEVESLRDKDPSGYGRRRASKKLAAIHKLAFEAIPADPASPAFRQGTTLGPAHRHWRRAKFFQQYRLFFRFDSTARIIVLAWVNDDDSLRAYEMDSNAYATFRRMLSRGNPPDSWDALQREARTFRP